MRTCRLDQPDRVARWEPPTNINVELTFAAGQNVPAHIALGFGFPELVDPSMRDRVNQAGDHLDVTVGSDEVAVLGYDRGGRERALLDSGRCQL